MLEGFSWIIPDKLAGMAHPGHEPEAFGELRGLGVGAVVTLTERPLAPEALKGQELVVLHLAIRDFAPPTREQVDRFVQFCELNIKAGRPVVAHCLAGRGRTGTMLACYLVSRGMGPAEALRTVRSRRPGSVETVAQEDAVFQYAAERAAERGKARKPARGGRR